MFAGTAIKATTKGHKHLRAAVDSRSHLEEYVNEKVVDWVREVTRLREFAGLLCGFHARAKALLDVLLENVTGYRYLA